MDIWGEFEKRNSDWELLILGDGILRDYLIKTIKEKNIKKVRLEGNKPNIEDYYEKASILLMTSLFEGLPLVLLESMSYGVVPIAFNNFVSLTDIIDSELNGYIIPSNDKNRFLEKLIYLTENQTILQKMSKASIQKSSKFSIKEIGEQWHKLLS